MSNSSRIVKFLAKTDRTVSVVLCSKRQRTYVSSDLPIWSSFFAAKYKFTPRPVSESSFAKFGAKLS